jgi:hypothetical protein
MAYQPIHIYYHLFDREVIVPSVISVLYKNPIFFHSLGFNIEVAR